MQFLWDVHRSHTLINSNFRLSNTARPLMDLAVQSLPDLPQGMTVLRGFLSVERQVTRLTVDSFVNVFFSCMAQCFL